MKTLLLQAASMLIVALVFAVSLVGSARADGDGSNNPHVVTTPAHIDEYVQQGGVWVRKLNRVQLPNGNFMLDPKNVNYYRDFKEYPCYYRTGFRDAYGCTNPGDTYRDKLISETVKPQKNIPEPTVIELLLLAVIAFTCYQITIKLS